ncbi:MAG TPA: Flp pilus assembly protein CpaB [Frankiaceae bacterium]|jgi:pilus assembly protein CpaB|nr:Flp pilus assembly protein CpaB [Frankiaceae bacterium]
MRSRNHLIIAVGIVLALLGAGTAVAYVKSDSSSGGGDTRAVVVATRDVVAGTPAATAPLAVRRLPSSAVPANAVASTQALNGQVALVAVSAGQVVTPAMFGVQGTAAQGGVVLPKGKKGIGVELGFAPGGLRYVVPGNTIDVLASAKADSGARTEVLLKGVEVIATTPGTGTGAAAPVSGGAGTLNFLLAVDEAQALKIVGAQASQRSLYFVLAGTRKGA